MQKKEGFFEGWGELLLIGPLSLTFTFSTSLLFTTSYPKEFNKIAVEVDQSFHFCAICWERMPQSESKILFFSAFRRARLQIPAEHKLTVNCHWKLRGKIIFNYFFCAVCFLLLSFLKKSSRFSRAVQCDLRMKTDSES